MIDIFVRNNKVVTRKLITLTRGNRVAGFLENIDYNAVFIISVNHLGSGFLSPFGIYRHPINPPSNRNFIVDFTKVDTDNASSLMKLLVDYHKIRKPVFIR